MERQETLNVAIVGGGPGCKAIIDMMFAERLSQLPMKLIGVSSTNPEAVGYRYAQEKGIYTTRAYSDLYKLEGLDMIIELTGRDELANEIARTKPAHVRLMDHVGARLFWDIFQIEEERLRERRRAHEALQRAEEEKETILDTLVEHVILDDSRMRIQWANRAACESAGLIREEILGRHCYEIWPQRDDPCPDCPVVAAMQTGHPRALEKTTPDGRVWFVRGYPVWDTNGDVVGGIEATLEITERKQAEGALRDSEKRFRETADLLPTVICETDRDTRVTYVNNLGFETFGYSEADLETGIRVNDLVHPDDRQMAAERIDRILRGEELPATEYRLIRKDGSEIAGLVNASPMFKDGTLTGMRISITDITDRKRLERQLQQAQKMEAIGTLAGGIAHDFNNLLMGIQGNVSLMSMDLDPSHPHYERLQNIEKQIQSGARLTSHLLGYARKGRYEVRPVDLNQLVETTAETFGRTRKDIIIDQQLAEDLFAVEVDPGQIEQVLFNLYVNAADAMPGGGDLILKTMNTNHKQMRGKLYEPKPGNYVLLMVTDTGTGMDKETMDRIFDPFFTTKEMGRGTGLGLASAYGIVKGHGGYIEIKSKEGHGTTFSIYLPASRKKVRERLKTAETIVAGTGTVLLADDEEVILGVGQELLEALGYSVLIARDGKEAVDVYKKHWDDIDFVLLDMVMPSMGGGEAYDRMKEINPDVKVLLVSGFSIDGEAREILERGCDGFIQKPFTMKELSGKIREILGKE